MKSIRSETLKSFIKIIDEKNSYQKINIEKDLINSISNLLINFNNLEISINNTQTIFSLSRTIIDYYSVYYLLYHHGEIEERDYIYVMAIIY